jgi:hypothetical protein
MVPRPSENCGTQRTYSQQTHTRSILSVPNIIILTGIDLFRGTAGPMVQDRNGHVQLARAL